MRTLLSWAGVVTLGLMGIAAEGAMVVKKKAPAKKGARPVASAHKRSGSAPTRTGSAKTTASRRGKKTVRRASTTWRNRQISPTPERYKEIQEALASKGYLAQDQASGKWDDASSEALRKFQTDQNLNSSGKINSLSLIALGLGPKRDPRADKLSPVVPATPPMPPAAAAPASPPLANF